jgi:ATP-dependent Lhr-like helicase
VPSDLDRGSQSSSFDLLHEHVRRWIWKQGWIGLRDIQEKSIPTLLDGSRDLIISAGTASGKTEAAFLPIVSRIASADRAPGAGFDAIYISPLRALINDQFGRMEGLCEELDIKVTKWHGDVAASVKAKALAKPSGIVLITPESLEATMVRKGPEIRRLCRGLSYVVVDEMHAFMDEPRGKQLQSLLHRLDIAAGSRVTRVGLSATLADEASSRRFLRPLAPDRVEVCRSKASQDVMLQVRGYIEPLRPAKPDKQALSPGEGEDPGSTAEGEIIKHIFRTLRGKRSLIFAGSRRRVETTTVGLSGLTEAAGVPEEFFAHHGNLSRDHREEAERRMKDTSRPASVVCTTTLELGIDVGAIDSVAQLGPGHTVSGMKQRLGRSGRRAGQVATMRVYVKEEPLAAADHPLDALRRETVQAIAMLTLMLEHWNEPPLAGRLHLSTLMHQILALIIQHGGLTAEQGWKQLVQSGVFEAVNLNTYRAVLRRMGHPDVQLIEQAPDGTLLPGKQGEIVTAGRDFYAVFMGASEFKVIESGGRPIGSVPDRVPFVVGQFLMLAGRRWRVVDVDEPRKEVVVVRGHGGIPPVFGGEPVPPSDGVIARMKQTYEGAGIPSFLDANATQLLTEARESFERLGLRHRSVCRHEDRLLIFPWTGPLGQSTLLLALIDAGMTPEQLGLAISVPFDQEAQLRLALAKLVNFGCPAPLDLAKLVQAKASDKYDHYLDEELLGASFASARLEVSFMPCMAAEIVKRWPN